MLGVGAGWTATAILRSTLTLRTYSDPRATSVGARPVTHGGRRWGGSYKAGA